MEKMVFTFIIFLLFLSLFAGSFISIRTEYQANYSLTNENVSVLNTGVLNAPIPPPPVCANMDSPFILFNIGNAGSCAATYVGWIFSLATVKSDIQWLGFIFIGIAAVLILVAIKIISGFIPTIPGVHN